MPNTSNSVENSELDLPVLTECEARSLKVLHTEIERFKTHFEN